MSTVKGYPSKQKTDLGSGLTENFQTVVPTDPFRYGADIPRFLFRLGAVRTAGAATGLISEDGVNRFYIEDTATPARPGDVVRFEDGNAQYLEIPIVKVDANRFLISCIPGDYAPASGDDFYIMRYSTQRVDSSGSQVVVASPGPSQFNRNGVATEVSEDTVTPGNSRPFPVKVLGTGGVSINPSTEAKQDALITLLTDLLGQQAEAASLSVVLASDQPTVPTSQVALGAGNSPGSASASTTASTLTAPANAIGFILMNLDSSTTNLRYRIGAVATTSSGQQLQPGRDTGYIPCAANISICAESGTPDYDIQWILSA